MQFNLFMVSLFFIAFWWIFIAYNWKVLLLKVSHIAEGCYKAVVIIVTIFTCWFLWIIHVSQLHNQFLSAALWDASFVFSVLRERS